MFLERQTPPDVCQWQLLSLAFFPPCFSRRALDGQSMRKLHWNCSLWSVYINTERWRFETGLSQNIQTTWCQSLIGSGSWTLGSENGELLRALPWLPFAAGVALRTSRNDKVAREWMYADLGLLLELFSFCLSITIYIMQDWKCLHSSQSAGLYAPHSSQLQERGIYRSDKLANWGGRIENVFTLVFF